MDVALKIVICFVLITIMMVCCSVTEIGALILGAEVFIGGYILLKDGDKQ